MTTNGSGGCSPRAGRVRAVARTRRGRASLADWAGATDVFLLTLKLGLLAVLFYLFFKDTVALGRFMKLGAALALASAALFTWSHGIKVRLTLPTGLFLAFFVYVLAREAALGLAGLDSWFVYFGATLATAALVSCCPERGEIAEFVVKAIVAFALVHAVATIVLWLAPSLYDDVVYPTFFSGNLYGATGYKSGLTTHYSTNGMYLALGLVSCSYFAFREGKGRAPSLVAMAILLFALLLTTKRAHLVFGVAALMVAYLAQAEGTGLTRGARLAAAVVALAVAFVVAASFVPDLWDVVDRIVGATDDETFGGRTGFYELCLELWGENPLFGAGWNSFSDLYFTTPDSAYRKSVGFTSMDAHNVFIQLLGEEGLVGLALFVAAAASSLRFAVLGARRGLLVGDGGVPRLLTWSVAVQTFFLLYCITGNPLYEIVEYVPYLLAVGCLALPARDLGGGPARVRRAARRGA